MNNATHKQRRQHFISPVFQGRFIAWMVGMIALFAICSAFLLYLLLSSDLQSGTQSAHASLASMWDRLGLSIVLGNTASALLAGVSVAVVVIYISHRIAGPMHRLVTLFDQVSRGNLDVNANLREKDQLKDVAESFGRMAEALRAQRNERLAHLLEAEQLLDELSELHAKGETSAEHVQRVRAVIAHLKEVS